MKTTLRRSGARTRSTRLAGPLVGLALAAALTACGDDPADETADDPAASTSTPGPSDTPTDTGTPTEEPEAPAGNPTPIEVTGSAGVTEGTLVHATEGGGSPSTLAFALDTDRAVQDFVTGLQNGLGERVARAVADAGRSTDATAYAALVSTGCEAPRSVAIDAGEAGFEVVPQLPKSTVQCLAPVTYVVVFAAPDA